MSKNKESTRKSPEQEEMAIINIHDERLDFKIYK